MSTDDPSSQPSSAHTDCIITHKDFGEYQNQTVTLFSLKNTHGMVVNITDFGGIITNMRVPDKNGVLADVVIGFDTLQDYVDDAHYVGALVGRYANRIGNGGFTLNGVHYPLHTNESTSILHGGPLGLNKKIWQAEPFTRADACGVTLTVTSPDGENGFPGTLTVKATYTLDNDNALTLTFEATTDKTTPVSLTNHSYFNLAGYGSVLGHQLQLTADAFLPVNNKVLPTGVIAPVTGTPFDFTRARALGEQIAHEDEQLKIGSGYDHNFVARADCQDLSTPFAVVTDPESGRILKVFTDSPGVQLYSGNFLGATGTGREQTQYTDRCALALEPQAFPDAPNRSAFPAPWVRPGETHCSTIVYKFSNI